MKTLQEDWLNGKIDETTFVGGFLFGTVQCFARIYFEKWLDTEAKECWHDFEILIDLFTTKQSREPIPLTNPITIILNLDSLKSKITEEYEAFLEKWSLKFESCTPFARHYLHKKKFEKGIISIRRSYSSPVPLTNILAALFILKQAACGNLSAVMDMYSIVSFTQNIELQLVTAPVEKSIRSSQSGRKKPITKLLEHILKEDPNYSNHTIFKRLNNQTEEEGQICRIKSAVLNGFVEYYKNKKSKKTVETIPYRNFISTISKVKGRIKINLKNKLP